MRPLIRLLPLLVLGVILSASSCEEPPIDDGIPDWDPLEAGVLEAGASGGTLNLPVGTPSGSVSIEEGVGGRIARLAYAAPAGHDCGGPDGDWRCMGMPTSSP